MAKEAWRPTEKEVWRPVAAEMKHWKMAVEVLRLTATDGKPCQEVVQRHGRPTVEHWRLESLEELWRTAVKSLETSEEPWRMAVGPVEPLEELWIVTWKLGGPSTEPWIRRWRCSEQNREGPFSSSPSPQPASSSHSLIYVHSTSDVHGDSG
ncbi:hypothetical protein CHARACLAT_019235 [Characodon lateralis]|uniref:Uncharacterized protein n=1 Tax=Characodon lateralis TaxID=208331 RepID=A0ABU7D837_9TELE|nr:hypothetical protein [Characodon lateralis]